MSNTKTEAQRLADGLLAETSKFGTPSIQRGLVNGAIQELRRLDAENSDLRERNAALGNAQEIALDTATEHALVADELRGALATAEAERDQLRAQLAKAVAEEREACAKVCDERAMMHYKNVTEDELERCAAAIRARSNT